MTNKNNVNLAQEEQKAAERQRILGRLWDESKGIIREEFQTEEQRIRA